MVGDTRVSFNVLLTQNNACGDKGKYIPLPSTLISSGTT